MKPAKGYYCVIQYCPDPGRFEAANVGVLLFCAERCFLDALTTRDNSRIRRFFGSQGHDWTRVNSLKRGLEERLKREASRIRTLDELREFIATRANLLQITEPKPIKVLDPNDDLKDLFRRIIGEPVPKTSKKGLRRYVGEQLAAAGVQDKVQRDIKVVVPVMEKEIEIPFGFRNGRLNLINPVRFEAAHPDQSVRTACTYAVEGQSLHDHPDSELGELQLIVVGKFRANDRETPRRVRHLLKEYDVRLFETRELPALVDEIRRTGQKTDGLTKSR